MAMPDWARAHGTPLFAAAVRSQLEDFDVTEILGFEPCGDGEHDYLFIEKTAANTEWVSRQLAKHAGVSAREVGYAGLKDRHAITRQWFSVPRWNVPDWSRLDVHGVRLLEQRRHRRKLRRGAHRQNRFRIVLRGALPDEQVLRDRLDLINTAGVPNYFGPQRFGRGGSNIALADAWAAGQRLPRHKRSLAISAARSWLFNEGLAQRVREKTWNRLENADMANLDGTGSVFEIDSMDADLVRRCEELDIHPVGPLFGDTSPSSNVPSGRENWLRAIRNARVKASYRSLRLRVAELEWSLATNSLQLDFVLGRGAFATAVLRELALCEDVAVGEAMWA